MVPTNLLLNGLWAGLFASAMALVFSAPINALRASFCCGFIARLVRDALVGAGTSFNLSVMLAAVAVVLVATLIIRAQEMPLVVMVTGLIPLGAAVAFFQAITGFLLVTRMKQGQAAETSALIVANSSKVFTTTLAMVLGVTLGVMLVQFTQKWMNTKGANTEERVLKGERGSSNPTR